MVLQIRGTDRKTGGAREGSLGEMLRFLIQADPLLLKWRPQWECLLKEEVPKGAVLGQVTWLQDGVCKLSLSTY